MRNNDNAANRYSYIGEIYSLGEQLKKRLILEGMPEKWRKLNEEGYIHIHDLDAYGMTYNCLTFNILEDFPCEKFNALTDEKKVAGVFGYITNLMTDMGNEQSGGMAFANFDDELAKIFAQLNLSLSDVNKWLISAAMRELILWCNDTHTRMGQTSYYVTFNIGLAGSDFARFIAYTLIDEFEKCGETVFKPNIVFKVKKGTNRFKGDKNYDLFVKALLCTAKKMIPTYLLCDCEEDKNIPPERLAVMGCRTRVADDVFGHTTSIGRGNIDNISINLPRLALEAEMETCNVSVEEKMQAFTQKWDEVAATVKDILLDRFEKVCSRNLTDFPINARHKLWCVSFDDIKHVFKHGTLSIGFIGLSEAMEVITGKRFYLDAQTCVYALGFVKHMREYCDFLRRQYNLNFSLLATSGELISGRFIEKDRVVFGENYSIFNKGFYTNSFHVNVDSNLSAFKKIEVEGMFHEYCNGGSITYVELGEAPISNDEGLREYIECAVNSGVHYLGFNFPKDVCKECGASGVFDICPVCGSSKITRIRRVSGYLEILDGFTSGKKNEEKTRRVN